jgi:hypothetical protein
MISKIGISTVILGLLLCPALWAGTSVIEVNLDNLTVSPEFPAVNNYSSDTILVKITGKNDFKPEDIISTLDVPSKDYYKDKNSFPSVGGRFVTLTFQRCAQAPAGKGCPDFDKNDAASSFTIYSDARSFAFKIFSVEAVADSAIPSRKLLKLNSLIGFPIQVEQKPFGLDFSAGFAGFAGVKDRRYRLVPIEGDSENASLVRASDKDVPYQFAAFAHYMPLRWHGTNGPAIGLAINVPVENLTIMAGWSFAARTLPIVNTGYLTFGLAYTQRNRLRADFEGRNTLPADTNIDTVVEKSYGLGAFVSISFGFFGGEQQFKGVFPASNGSGGK